MRYVKNYTLKENQRIASMVGSVLRGEFQRHLKKKSFFLFKQQICPKLAVYSWVPFQHHCYEEEIWRWLNYSWTESAIRKES